MPFILLFFVGNIRYSIVIWNVALPKGPEVFRHIIYVYLF